MYTDFWPLQPGSVVTNVWLYCDYSAWLPCAYTEFGKEDKSIWRQTSQFHNDVPCGFFAAQQRANPVWPRVYSGKCSVEFIKRKSTVFHLAFCLVSTKYFGLLCYSDKICVCLQVIREVPYDNWNNEVVIITSSWNPDSLTCSNMFVDVYGWERQRERKKKKESIFDFDCMCMFGFESQLQWSLSLSDHLIVALEDASLIQMNTDINGPDITVQGRRREILSPVKVGKLMHHTAS